MKEPFYEILFYPRDGFAALLFIVDGRVRGQLKYATGSSLGTLKSQPDT
jgi:hypothetical protein